MCARLDAMRVALAVVCLFMVCAPAGAKPLGLYDCGHTPPSWVAVCTIADTEPDRNFVDARMLSERRGIVWLLQLGYHEDPRLPIGPHAARILDRLDATGLRPYVAAVSVGEEWYEHWQAGTFARLGLTSDNMAGMPIIHDWLGKQHLAAKTVLGVPVVWITGSVNALRPVPAHTDLVALDPYVTPGHAFTTAVAPVLAVAEQSTPLPLVLIAQWFHAEGYAKPKAEDVAQYLAWLARPRWVALLGFTGRSRPWAGITGLADLPDLRAAVDDAVGVKQ